jgi:hypothetical protein
MIEINYDGFYASLSMMWKGMLGLFVFAIFVMFITMILKALMRKKAPPEDTSA